MFMLKVFQDNNIVLCKEPCKNRYLLGLQRLVDIVDNVDNKK